MPLLELAPAFVDHRGWIQPLSEYVQVIFSKAGAQRAGHYHKRGAHYCFIISGAMRYSELSFDNLLEDELPYVYVVGPLNGVYTPPMTAHWMEFSVDTFMVVISTLPRDQESYEQDTVRVNGLANEGSH